MAVSRYNKVRRVTPIQTYVSERIDLPFKEVREDLKMAQAEQDTNLASATQLAGSFQSKGYEGASDEHAKSVLTSMDDRVRNILSQGDLRGAGADISNLALDFKQEVQTGSLKNMEQDLVNYDRYKALNDSKLGSAAKGVAQFEHNKNKGVNAASGEKTTGFDWVAENSYTDVGANKAVGDVLTGIKDRTINYDSVGNLINNRNIGSYVTPNYKTTANTDGTTTQEQVGYVITTKTGKGIPIDRAQAAALANAMANTDLVNRAKSELALEVLQNDLTGTMTPQDAYTSITQQQVEQRLVEDVAGEVKEKIGFDEKTSKSISNLPSGGSGSGDDKDPDDTWTKFKTTTITNPAPLTNLEKSVGNVEKILGNAYDDNSQVKGYYGNLYEKGILKYSYVDGDEQKTENKILVADGSGGFIAVENIKSGQVPLSDVVKDMSPLEKEHFINNGIMSGAIPMPLGGKNMSPEHYQTAMDNLANEQYNLKKAIEHENQTYEQAKAEYISKNDNPVKQKQEAVTTALDEQVSTDDNKTNRESVKVQFDELKKKFASVSNRKGGAYTAFEKQLYGILDNEMDEIMADYGSYSDGLSSNTNALYHVISKRLNPALLKNKTLSDKNKALTTGYGGAGSVSSSSRIVVGKETNEEILREFIVLNMNMDAIEFAQDAGSAGNNDFVEMQESIAKRTQDLRTESAKPKQMKISMNTWPSSEVSARRTHLNDEQKKLNSLLEDGQVTGDAYIQTFTAGQKEETNSVGSKQDYTTSLSQFKTLNEEEEMKSLKTKSYWGKDANGNTYVRQSSTMTYIDEEGTTQTRKFIADIPANNLDANDVLPKDLSRDEKNIASIAQNIQSSQLTEVDGYFIDDLTMFRNRKVAEGFGSLSFIKNNENDINNVRWNMPGGATLDLDFSASNSDINQFSTFLYFIENSNKGDEQGMIDDLTELSEAYEDGSIRNLMETLKTN